MGIERRNMPEQERSIKDREQELFFEPDDAAARPPLRPFPDYLKATPPDPMPPAVKAILWVVGILVALLFLAAIWRVHRSHRGSAPDSKASKTETTVLARDRPYQAWVADGTMGLGVVSASPLPCRRFLRSEPRTDCPFATGSTPLDRPHATRPQPARFG
jgi:hypothetical protein